MKYEKTIRCPKCGSSTFSQIYMDGDKDIVGCDDCLRWMDLWEYSDYLSDREDD